MKTDLKTRISFILLIAFAVVLYIVVTPYYRINNEDTPWMLSAYWDLFHNGNKSTDLLDTHMLSLENAGLILAWINAYILELIGWTKYNAYLIASFFTAAGFVVWVFILKKLQFSKLFIIAFVCAMAVLEPFYGMSTQARPDSFTFFCISLTLLLFMHGRFFWSALICMIGVETHIIGMTAAFFCLAYLITYPQIIFENRKKAVKSFIYLFIGATLGLALYLLLHYQYIPEYLITIKSGLGGQSIFESNYILAYFFLTKAKRHLPELVILIFSLVIFIRLRLYQKPKYRFALWATGLAIFSSIIFARGNFHYMALIYPALLLVIIAAFYETKLVWLINIIWVALLLPQYAAVVYIDRDFPGMQKYIDTVRAHTPEGDETVYGNFNMWFALHADRNFYHYTRIATTDNESFIVTGANERFYPKIEDLITKRSGEYDCRLIDSYTIHKDNIKTWLCNKKQ